MSASKNGTFDAGAYGTWDVWVESISHGFYVLSSESETRRYRTFYPAQAISGYWFVNIIFDSHEEHQRFSQWLADFFRAVADPYGDTPQPITVSVPSRGFSKQGYPDTAVSFGDELGKVVYREAIQFSSAHSGFKDEDASRFSGPAADGEGYFFYPPGIQPSDLVNPGPGPMLGVIGDDNQVYGGGGGSRHLL